MATRWIGQRTARRPARQLLQRHGTRAPASWPRVAPALRALYPEREARLERLAEHTAYFNTQPTLASIALGAAARVEEERARGGAADAASMARLKSVLGSTLAALGDRLFWFSLRPLAAAIGVLVAMTHPSRGWCAMALWLVYAVPHLTMRFGGVAWGYAAGPALLSGAFRAGSNTRCAGSR